MGERGYNPRMSRYWLVKSEPDCFSFRDLLASPGATTAWEGVRNYQARNLMRDEMRVGDGVLFYHSSTVPPHLAGVARVASAPYPDRTQFDRDSEYFDPAATPQSPRWFVVDLRAERELPEPLTLERLRADPALDGMELLRRGSRLSVQAVNEAQWNRVLELAGLVAAR